MNNVHDVILTQIWSYMIMIWMKKKVTLHSNRILQWRSTPYALRYHIPYPSCLKVHTPPHSSLMFLLSDHTVQTVKGENLAPKDARAGLTESRRPTKLS